MYARNPNAEKYLGDKTHIVSGFSKDLNLSGLRAGTIFTHNSPLLKALDNLGMFSQTSNHS